MNVCVFSIVNYWHGVRGGMEIHGKLLTEGLVRSGHQVSIITTRHPDGQEYEEKQGVGIHYLKDTRFGARRNNWPQASVSKFRQLNKEQPFYVVLSQSFAAYGLASGSLNFRIPVVPMLQGCIKQGISSFRTNVLRDPRRPVAILRSFAGLFYSYYAVEKPLLSMAASVVVVSNELKDDLRRWYGESIADKAVVIFNGIDTERFSPNPGFRRDIREKYGVAEREILLLSLGTVNREKGHHLAVAALERILPKNPDTKLMIVGTGEYEQTIKKEIGLSNLGGNVLFTGHIDNLETPKYYNAADIFLMPTLRIEGLPFVLLEAMACGKPVIASQIGGNTSVVHDKENGLLVQPGNVDELADGISLLLNNKELASELSSSARTTVLDDFNIDQMVDKTLSAATT